MTDDKLEYWLKVWREPKLQQSDLPVMEEEQVMTDWEDEIVAKIFDESPKDADWSCCPAGAACRAALKEMLRLYDDADAYPEIETIVMDARAALKSIGVPTNPDMEKITMNKFEIGNRVKKVGGDSNFEGIVVAAFSKLGGQRRYVVEDNRGLLLIQSDKTLEAITDKQQ